MFPHEYRRVLEEQAKEAAVVKEETPVVTPVTNGPENEAAGEEQDQNKEDFNEEIINPIMDDDPNRKEVIVYHSFILVYLLFIVHTYRNYVYLVEGWL